jgi:hypothetical protein
MELDFKEIAKAWYNSFNHTYEQKELADKRFEICLECPSKKEILKGKEWSLKCEKCGCPLSKKIYTDKTYLNKHGSCPLNKWEEIEKEYLIKTDKFDKIKHTKTFI